MSPYRISLIGFGNIGTGFVRHLIEHRDLLTQRVEGGIELAWIADKEFDRPRDVTPPSGTKMTLNWREAVDDPTVRAVVELVGVGADGKPSLAFEVAKRALAAGKHFITANKGLIAVHGAELHDLAEQHGAYLLYEASVGAGIPLISSLQGGLAPDRITSIHGIVNGTCNHILTRLEEDAALSLDAAVKEAQKMGFAEPDPKFDIEGDDSAYKIVILGSLAFGQELKVSDVRLEGITRLGAEEMRLARENGLSLKLLASAVRHDSGVEVTVGPAFVPQRHVLAGVRGVYNGILIDAEPIGTTMYYGRGAGQGSTGSGLLSDVIAAARLERAGMKRPFPLRIPRGGGRLVPPAAVRGKWYVRIGTAGGDAGAKALSAFPRGERAGETARILEDVSLTELDNLLGKLEATGVPSSSIIKVRFPFGS